MNRKQVEPKAGVDGVDMERIEVLMATYNGKSYIREQIDSILNQTYENWHLTISDDGSTDGTDLIIDEYVKEYPDKMRRLMDAMQNAEEKWSDGMPILVFSDQKVVDEKLNIIAPSLMRYQKQAFDHFDYRAILMQNVVTGGAMMMNRSLCDLALQCRSREQTIMHDWWIAAVAARFGKIVYLDESLSLYRQHGHNSVGAKRVGSAGYVAKMIGSLREVRKAIKRKKIQAGAFEETYSSLLTKDDRQFLDKMKQNRSGLGFYLKNRRYIHGFFRLMGFIILG